MFALDEPPIDIMHLLDYLKSIVYKRIYDRKQGRNRFRYSSTIRAKLQVIFSSPLTKTCSSLKQKSGPEIIVSLLTIQAMYLLRVNANFQLLLRHVRQYDFK